MKHEVGTKRHRWLTLALLATAVVGVLTTTKAVHAAETTAAPTYATVTTNYPVWQSLAFTSQVAHGTVYQKTFKVTATTQKNGQTYLALTNSAAQTVGEINQRGVKETAKSQGAWLKASGYATTNKANALLYRDLSDSSATTPAVAEVAANGTYVVKGKYNTFAGKTYYSMYGEKNQWAGYLLAGTFTATTKPQGVWLSYKSNVKVTKNYPLWRSFNWRQNGTTHQYKTLRVNGYYAHSNGSTYYSLYTQQGKWVGYANATAFSPKMSATQGTALPNRDGRTVKVTKRYNSWRNFAWDVKASAKTLYGKTFTSKYFYDNTNGQTYLSLYNAKGQWFGYINDKAVTVVSSN